MFRSVIVPLDGSEAAESAVPVAQAEAGGHHAQLVLMRVVPWPEPPSFPRRHGGLQVAHPAPPDPAIGAARREAMDYLHGLVARFNLALTTHRLVLVGDPYLRMAAEIARRPGSVVVVARENGPLVDTPLGSAVQRILHHGLAPVMTVCPPPAPRPAIFPTGEAVVGESMPGW